jgi:DNA-binding HxlR family transcriptional regulator
MAFHGHFRAPAQHEFIVTEEDLLAFVGTTIGSVWTLELLLLLKRHPQRSWRTEELIRELRGSQVVIAEALKMLQGAGLVVEDAGGHRYQAASSRLDELVSELETAYATKPMTVIKAIVAAPSDKLRIFSDAFRFKD